MRASDRDSGAADGGSDSAAFLFDGEPNPFAETGSAVRDADGAWGEGPEDEDGGMPGPGPIMRVVSLRAVDRILGECPRHPLCGDSLFLELGGIKTLQGVIFDGTREDALLFGRIEGAGPAFRLEDLVVALRNAWLAYAHRKGNRITYLHPGVSLDPAPANLKELGRIARAIARIDASGGEKALERWKEVCGRPYRVSVTGLPAGSRFARTLLRADYDMKALANGSGNPDIPGFPDMAELRRIRHQGEYSGGGSASPPPPSLTRYWFHPGSQEWEAGEDIVVIKRSPVTLMTGEALDRIRGGGSSGRGRGGESGPDDPAEAFAFGFTRMFGELAASRPVYREMENLFRLVAAAKLVRDRHPESRAHADFPALAGSYALEPGDAEPDYRGLPGLQHFDAARGTATGMEIDRRWLPSCGGVTVAVEPSKAWIRRAGDPGLPAFRKLALAKRPPGEGGAWHWDVPGAPGDYWERLADRLRMQELCLRFPDLAFYRLRGGGKALEVRDQDGLVIARGEIRQALEAMAERAEARKVHAVFVDLAGWPAAAAREFRDASAAFVRGRQAGWALVPVADRPGWLSAANPLFSQGAEWLQGEPPLEKVVSGGYKGWHRLTYRFRVRAAGRTVTVPLHAMVKSEEVAARLREESAAAFRARLFIAYSPLTALIAVLSEFREGLPEGERKDIRIVEDEAGLVELG